MNIRTPKLGDVRMIFHDRIDGYSWIYDIPLPRLPALEKFVLDNYEIINFRSEYPRAGYTVASHIAKNFADYLVNEYEDNNSDYDDQCDYLIVEEHIYETMTGDIPVDSYTTACIVILIYFVKYMDEKEHIDIEPYSEMWRTFLNGGFKMPNLPNRLVKRFDHNNYDVTIEIGNVLQEFMDLNQEFIHAHQQSREGFPTLTKKAMSRPQIESSQSIRSPSRLSSRSTVRSPVRSSVQSPVRSPSRSVSRSRSPSRSPIRSPIRSPRRSIELPRSSTQQSKLPARGGGWNENSEMQSWASISHGASPFIMERMASSSPNFGANLLLKLLKGTGWEMGENKDSEDEKLESEDEEQEELD